MGALLIVFALSAASIDYGPVELCDEVGWCLPLAGFRPRRAIAMDEALAVMDRYGGGALWMDGAWRTSFWLPPEAELRCLKRDGAQVELTTCAGKRCELLRLPDGRRSEVPPPRGCPKAPDWRRAGGELEDGTPWRTSGRKLQAGLDGGWQEVTSCSSLGYQLFQTSPSILLGCSGYTTYYLERYSRAGGLESLHAPWSTDWLDLHIQVFEETAGCAPCLLGVLALWKDAAGWHGAPAPRDLDWAPDDWGYRPKQVIRMARAERPIIQIAGVAKAWNGGAWEATDYAGPWADEVRSRASVAPDGKLQAIADQAHFSTFGMGTAQHLITFLDGNLFALRDWSSFGAGEDQPVGWARVVNVAANDTLNLRAGPISVAPLVEQLPPGTSCLRLLKASSRVSGSEWRLVQSPSGRRGWVNAKFAGALKAADQARCEKDGGRP